MNKSNHFVFTGKTKWLPASSKITGLRLSFGVTMCEDYSTDDSIFILLMSVWCLSLSMCGQLWHLGDLVQQEAWRREWNISSDHIQLHRQCPKDIATSYTETTSLNSHSIILVSTMNQTIASVMNFSCFSSASWLDRRVKCAFPLHKSSRLIFSRQSQMSAPQLLTSYPSSSFVCEHGLSILATGCWGRTPPSRWESRLRNPWFAIPFVGNHYIDNPAMAYYLTFALLPHQEPHYDSANCATLCELHPRQCIVVELHCSHHPI